MTAMGSEQEGTPATPAPLVNKSLPGFYLEEKGTEPVYRNTETAVPVFLYDETDAAASTSQLPKIRSDGGLNREYNLVLAAIDRALRPPPERDAIVDASIIEGPEVDYPNITGFQDAVKMVGGNVCLVSDEWNLVEQSRFKRSHEEIVKERLVAAKEEIEGFSFVHHFAVTSTNAKVTAPSDVEDGDYFYYSIRKGESNDEVGLTPTLARQNDDGQKITPADWRIAPLSKANNKIFHIRDDSPAETGGTIPTLLQMMPPAYGEEFGGAQWKELVTVFDGLLKRVEERDKEVVSFFDELTPGRSTEEADLSFIDWLLRRVGGDDISSVFNYHISHTDLDKRAAAHHVGLRRFLPAILNTMQSRNLARYPSSPLSTLLWFAVGEGWSGWRDLKIIVLDHSHFINGFVGTAPDYLKPLHVDLITNFGNIYGDPELAIKQFASIAKNVIPMHLSWNLVDIDTMSIYSAADSEYRSETERYNAKEGFKSVYKRMPDQLGALLSGPVEGVKKYSRDGQLIS